MPKNKEDMSDYTVSTPDSFGYKFRKKLLDSVKPKESMAEESGGLLKSEPYKDSSPTQKALQEKVRKYYEEE